MSHSAVCGQVDTLVATKFEEENLRYAARKDFAMCLFASLDHDMCVGTIANAKVNIRSIFIVEVIDHCCSRPADNGVMVYGLCDCAVENAFLPRFRPKRCKYQIR